MESHASTTATTATAETKSETEREIWLLGQPPLQSYLDFVTDVSVDPEALEPAALVAEWRRANDYYQQLEDTEAGIADTAECRDLDPQMAALVEAVAADPRYRRTFDTLPARFGMVELDKLILHQKSVTADFIDSLKTRLGPSPDAETVFRTCIPMGGPSAPFSIRRINSRRYSFESASTDFRYLEATLLRGDQITNYIRSGSIAGVVGLVVGFGSNFLNVVRADNRCMLNNGYHRACALRGLGYTHAPAVIQTVTSMDELALTVKSKVAEDPDFYFRSARPPLLKDFFDPRIRKELVIRKQRRIVEVNFDVKDYLVSA